MAHTSRFVHLLAAVLLVLGAAGVATLPSAQAGRTMITGSVTVAPSRSAGNLGPLITIPQTWNNCGPSSVAEVLAYWGISRTQGQVQAVLRADGNPHGMSPYGVPAYMRSLGLRALLGIAGSQRLVKALISNGFPVIVSQYVSLADHVGHYRPIQSYNDGQRSFVSSDPYLGQGHVIGYDEFDAIWQNTNRRFMVLYPPARQNLLNAVLTAAGWNKTPAYRKDLARVHGLLTGTVADTTGYGHPRNYALALAWDELQLGQYAASRKAIDTALRQGANPVVAGWISAELALASHT